jgi:hypothetical protein
MKAASITKSEPDPLLALKPASSSCLLPIVNYGNRYRNGETISTAFVESTVNEVISKRFVKKQQMRWTKVGAHNLLQVRTQVLNDDIYHIFCKWYPGMIETSISNKQEEAA